MFVSQKDFDQFSDRITRMLAMIQLGLGGKRCGENACKYCKHGTVVVNLDGTAKTVCGKDLKAQCADFTPRDFAKDVELHLEEQA